MSKFQFIGDVYGEGPDFTNFMNSGVEFELDGDFVEVEDEAMITKLEGNNCFIAEGEERAPIQLKLAKRSAQSFDEELANLKDAVDSLITERDQMYPTDSKKKTTKSKSKKQKSGDDSKRMGFPGDDD